jgi:tripartite-type tricarboxylate transporter receptor subunit TctC
MRQSQVNAAITRRNLLKTSVGIASSIGLGVPALALEKYPSQPIHIIVPFTPGSGSDSGARFFGEKIASLLKTSAVVENKPGGNGLITIQTVKSAPADGYTLLLGNISLMAVNVVALKNLSYDPLEDFVPLSGLYRGPAVYAVPTDSRIGSLSDLIAQAKNKKINIGTYSQGYQLAVAYLANLAGFEFENIPYKGQAPLIADLVGNQLDAALLDFGGAVAQIQAGKVKALALTGTQRHEAVPTLETVKEAGFPEYEHYSWIGLFARSGTPPEHVDLLSNTIQSILKTPEAAQFARSVTGEIMPFNSAQMRAYMVSQIERFNRIAKIANIVPQ